MNFEKHMALLRRRQRGELSGADQEALNNYEQTEEGRTSRRLWDAAGAYKQGFQPDEDQALARFRQRLASEKVGRSTRLISRRGFYWAAASVAVLLAVGLSLILRSSASDTRHMLAEDQMLELNLPDGSTVVLNKGAELIYPSDFGDAPNRKVELIGEAYFSISPNPNQPFIISTKMTEVEVLGTAFNLRALPDEDFTEVEVEEGKVAMREMTSGARESIVLTSKKCGSFHPGMGFKKEDAPMLNRLAWQRKKLQFVNTPLSEVLPMMERFYNIEILGKDQLDNEACPISGNWFANDLSEIVKVIAALTPLELVKKPNGKYQLKGEGC